MFWNKKKERSISKDIEEILKLAKKQGASVQVVHGIGGNPFSGMDMMNNILGTNRGLSQVFEATTYATIRVVLWGIKNRGLEKTLEDMRNAVGNSKMFDKILPITDGVYNGLIGMVKKVSEKGGEDK